MLLTIFRSGCFPPSCEAAAAWPAAVAGAGCVPPAGVALGSEFAEPAVAFWAALSDTTEPLLHAAPDNATDSATATINRVCVPPSICSTVLYYRNGSIFHIPYSILNMEYDSAPGHGRQSPGSRKIIERSVRIYSQADLRRVERDRVSIHCRRQHFSVAALFGAGANRQHAAEWRVRAFSRQAVTIKNHE